MRAMRSGHSRRMRARIITVDPTTRTVEAMLKDNAIVRVAVWEVPSAFRWPKEGEFWSINMIEGNWHLGERLDTGAERKPIEELEQGDMRLEAPGDIEMHAESVKVNGLDVHGVDPSIASGQGLIWNGTGWDATNLATQAELDAVQANVDAVWAAGDLKLSLQSSDHGDLGSGRFAWLKCDGRTDFLFSNYPILGPLAGSSFGGNGTTTFGLPDLEGRIALAQGDHADLATLGASDNLASANRKMKHRHGLGSLGISIQTWASNNIGTLGQIMRGTDADGAPRNLGTFFTGEVGDTTGPLNAPAHQVAGRAWFVRAI